MPTATITANDIITRYADDIAFVAEEDLATDLVTLIDQLYTVGRRFGEAGINGHEDMETAAVFLNEARNSDDETSRNILLGRADKYLTEVSDMVQDYRCMVGD